MINAAPIANQPNPFTPSTPEPVSPTSTPVVSSPKKSRKINLKLVIGLIILLFVVVGSVAAYFLMQTSQDVRQQAATGVYPCCVEGQTVQTSISNCKNMGGTQDACASITCPNNGQLKGSENACAQSCAQTCVKATDGLKRCCPVAVTCPENHQLKGSADSCAQSCSASCVLASDGQKRCCQTGVTCPNNSDLKPSASNCAQSCAQECVLATDGQKRCCVSAPGVTCPANSQLTASENACAQSCASSCINATDGQKRCCATGVTCPANFDLKASDTACTQSCATSCSAASDGQKRCCPKTTTCPVGSDLKASANACAQNCALDCINATDGQKRCCPTGGNQQCTSGQIKLTQAQSCQGAHLYSYVCTTAELESNGACYKRRIDLGERPLGSCIDLTARSISGANCTWTQYDYSTSTAVGNSNCGAWWASTCGGGGGNASPTPAATPTNNPTPPASSQPPASSKPSVPPTTPPVGPQCISIKKNIADPGISDNVVFTCGAVQGATEYRFRVIEPDGNIKSLKATGRVSAGYKIAKSGRHFAQCTICYKNSANKNTCIPWESYQ